MDPIVRHLTHDRVTAAQSADAVGRYIDFHLRRTAEGSEPIRYVDGYLSREHDIQIQFLDPGAWLAAGMTVTELLEGRIPAGLIRNLQMGLNRQGEQLLPNRIAVPKPVDEVLCTTPGEISHAIEAGFVDRETYVDLVLRENHRQLCLRATRVSRGGRNDKQRWTYVEGRTLSLAVYHARNQGQEPHSHLHILTFAPVLLPDKSWHSFGMKGHLQVLHKGGGRQQLTHLMTGMLERQGIQVVWEGGRARDQVGCAFGPRLQFVDGSVVEPGQVAHQRGGTQRAIRELYRQISLSLPTVGDMGLLRAAVPKRITRDKNETEQSLWAVMAYVRKVLRWPRKELSNLPGLSLEWLDQVCAQAQWWLRFGWPGPAGEKAAEILDPLREALASELDEGVQGEHDDQAQGAGAAQVVGVLGELATVGDRKGVAPSAVKYALQRRGLILRKSAHYLHDILDTGARIYGLSLGEAEAVRLGRSLGGGDFSVPWRAEVETGAHDPGLGSLDSEGFRVGSWSRDPTGDEGPCEDTRSGSDSHAVGVPDHLQWAGADDQSRFDRRRSRDGRRESIAPGGPVVGGTGFEADPEGGPGNRGWHSSEPVHPLRDAPFPLQSTEGAERTDDCSAGDPARFQQQASALFRAADGRSDSGGRGDLGAGSDAIRIAEAVDREPPPSQGSSVLHECGMGTGPRRNLQHQSHALGALGPSPSDGGSSGHPPSVRHRLPSGSRQDQGGSRKVSPRIPGPRGVEPYRSAPGTTGLVQHGGLPRLGGEEAWQADYWRRRRLAAAYAISDVDWAMNQQPVPDMAIPAAPISSVAAMDTGLSKSRRR